MINKSRSNSAYNNAIELIEIAIANGSTELALCPPNLGSSTFINEISGDGWNENRKLSDLDLQNLMPALVQVTTLTSLNLSDNYLTSLPPDIGNLENLEVLDLSNNKLTKLPVEIIKLGNLRHLDLRNNKLKIPPEILEKT
jgi:Leucine-rich repeat (LRR) protein